MMILQILKTQNFHGYGLVLEIRRASNNLIRVQWGSLYQALQRLSKAKCVEVQRGVSSTNRRVRIYKLTAAGGKRLEREVSRFQQMFEGITLVLTAAQTPRSGAPNAPTECMRDPADSRNQTV